MGRRPRSHAVLGFAALAGGCLGGPVTAHAFDCAKASLGVDYVICADQRLVAAIDDMGRVWRRIKAATPADQFAPLLADQREWVKTYGPSCGLPAKGQPDARRIAEAAPCISARVGERLAYLKGVEAGAAASDAANREWTRGFAQGTVEAGVRNAAGGAFTISCPFGQLETAPTMAFKASSGDERGETGAPAFTLLVDGNTPILSVNTGGDQQSFTWSPLNDSEFAVMETVIERVRTASRFAVELPNSGRREEFSTRNAPEALKGVLNGCAPTDAAMAEAPLPAAAPTLQPAAGLPNGAPEEFRVPRALCGGFPMSGVGMLSVLAPGGVWERVDATSFVYAVRRRDPVSNRTNEYRFLLVRGNTRDACGDEAPCIGLARASQNGYAYRPREMMQLCQQFMSGAAALQDRR